MNEMSVSAGLISILGPIMNDVQSPSTSTIHRFIYDKQGGSIHYISSNTTRTRVILNECFGVFENKNLKNDVLITSK